MRPARPIGNSREAIFWQWAYDSLIELQPMSGPGVLTNRTTRGVMQRMLGSALSAPAKPPEVCTLPVLNPDFIYFGYWYDAGSQLHLWNTTMVDHGNPTDVRRWARFTNLNYVSNIYDAGYHAAWILEDTPISLCIAPPKHAQPQTIAGPYDYALRWSFLANGIGIGQYWDVEIVDPRANCGAFWGGPAALPPTTPYYIQPDNVVIYEAIPLGGPGPGPLTPESYPKPITQVLPY